jgi:hypothetical protein
MSADGDDVSAGSFGTSQLPAVSIPSGCSEGATRELLSTVSWVRFARTALAHRGCYERATVPVPEASLAELLELASECARRPLTVAMHQWSRLRAGDYSLARDDDAWAERLTPTGIDLTVDLSADASGEAEVVFTHRGQPFFTMPQRPREVSIVQRGPTVRRYERYLTHRLEDHVVTRLRLGLVPSS